MLRIDFYVQHLTKHDADYIELASGKPVKFQLPSGVRHSSKPIDHGQLTALVEEAAPTAAIESLRSTGAAKFFHKSGATDIDVTLRAESPTEWTVRLEPASAGISLGSEIAESSPEPPRSSGGQAAAGGYGGQPATGGYGGQAGGYEATRAGEPGINRYLRLMKEMGASDLHLSSTVAPMARVDGSMRELEPGKGEMTPERLESLLMEIMPDKNKEEFEAVSDTDYAHTIEGLARFRVNVFEDRHGIGAVFRVIPFDILSVDQIGLPKKVLDLCWLTKGLVLVTGPTGSGKSTTLATLIDYINQNREDHIITIEDPIEFVHSNKKCLVNQREVGTHTKSFKAALRAALREDPDIVLVGEMRDLETISIAIETAETGHLVFGTLHTTSAPSTVDRIIDQFPPDQQEQIRVMLSESLRGVIAQVLCKKQGGGRVAGYEVLIANAACANLIREGKTFQLKSVMQTGRRQGMQTMNDHLLQHVQAGLITPQEAYVKSNDKSVMKTQLAQAGHQLNLGD
jgi:twitching motility protein PilT